MTQLIYIKDDQEHAFDEFEKIAIPIISRYLGNMMLRIRPEKSAVIEASVESPYEIHLVSFEDENGFNAFLADDERKRYLHLKEQSITSVLLFKGEKI